MIKLWQLLLHACWHRWEYIGSGPLTHEGASCGQYYVYKCAKCQRIDERYPK